jgi:hypothetical protein
MKKTSCVVCAMALSCICCCGQTNTCAGPPGRFFLPPLKLRAAVELETRAPKPALSVEEPSAAPAETVMLESTLKDGGLPGRVIRSDQFYLARPEPLSFVDGIFRPEAVHLGKTSVSCSLLTALKRKNPLCLLSPIVFQLSW